MHPPPLRSSEPPVSPTLTTATVDSVLTLTECAVSGIAAAQKVACPDQHCKTLLNSKEALAVHLRRSHCKQTKVKFRGSDSKTVIVRNQVDGRLHCPCLHYSGISVTAFSNHAAKCDGQSGPLAVLTPQPTQVSNSSLRWSQVVRKFYPKFTATGSKYQQLLNRVLEFRNLHNLSTSSTSSLSTTTTAGPSPRIPVHLESQFMEFIKPQLNAHLIATGSSTTALKPFQMPNTKTLHSNSNDAKNALEFAIPLEGASILHVGISLDDIVMF
ncbi:hypothetical protein BCR33DRAFT_718405 [Rhizoclosmatium globosum]|uniref:C2H2-type domain-containing protein n=1 Tax=Rhizoclosmatium globosum TaxID=329046 RepID=A0A1Y2C5Q8_9FUNG|nr:hypothetical protein BCR33DRAFT_718405 [Rhizoclosmatium globosum]|eukprot:ORY42214.1 hypothetical protein BCR33DRAFT_718405 [Rhizoclosmatium globosum]